MGKREKVAQNSKNSRGDRVEVEVQDGVVVVAGRDVGGIVGGYRCRYDVRRGARTKWAPGLGRHKCGDVEHMNRKDDCSSKGGGEEEEEEEEDNEKPRYYSRRWSNRVDPLLM